MLPHLIIHSSLHYLSTWTANENTHLKHILLRLCLVKILSWLIAGARPCVISTAWDLLAVCVSCVYFQNKSVIEVFFFWCANILNHLKLFYKQGCFPFHFKFLPQFLEISSCGWIAFLDWFNRRAEQSGCSRRLRCSLQCRRVHEYSPLQSSSNSHSPGCFLVSSPSPFRVRIQDGARLI